MVHVVWTDSHRPNPIWVSLDDIEHEEAICNAVGIVVKWDKVGITLATCSQGDSFGSTFFIPAGAIKHVYTLEAGEKTRRPVLASKTSGSLGTTG
jgi:hypothetical protein